ncbi:MAG: histidine phosphatase family protein [Pseudomonadota bacterium]
MRELIVFRHAKSSWDDPELEDIDRPLNARGKRDAPEMGQRLSKEGRVPDRICCSPAHRARATAELLAPTFALALDRILMIESLYPGDPQDWLCTINALADDDERVLLIGHNPGLTDTVNALADEDIDNVPTAAYAAIALDSITWEGVEWGSGQLTRFDYPKSRKRIR